MAQASPLAATALSYIQQFYRVETSIRGKPPDERRRVRQAQAGPVLDEVYQWLHATLSQIPRKSALADAIRYGLARWIALTRYRDDGCAEIDNNAAERALRCVALGRKNYLFVGSDNGGERAASLYSLIGSALCRIRHSALCWIQHNLGFTFYLGRARKGQIIPMVKSSGKRLRAKLKRVKDWIKKAIHKYRLMELWRIFRAKLRGHIQYYGVSFNTRYVVRFLETAKRIVFQWLNRRSERKSFNWEQFNSFFNSNPLPTAKVHHALF